MNRVFVLMDYDGDRYRCHGVVALEGTAKQWVSDGNTPAELNCRHYHTTYLMDEDDGELIQ